jgi:hypothetical protein
MEFQEYKFDKVLGFIINNLSGSSMKLFLAAAILGLASAQTFEELEICINERCPAEAKKCDDNCKTKLKNCSVKCGLKVDQVCWGGCVGLFGPATNVALCAANKGCLNNSLDEENG